jgi:hypothetical protein
MSLKTKKPGGGCACGGGCGGGCGCGPTDVAARGTAFVRPRFFGGMLLTEDDLESLTDYVIGKRRLTNRYVFGPGVVCGLTVSCDPCERGSVVVGPGYAIDCCGNDVVVDCPTQVDVIALVRELRQRSGVDCGEPCEDQPCAGYVLNVVYTEQPSDPVAPYADDDCTVGDCEFSRVREGYRFELSCDAPEPEPTIVDILEDCLRVDDERVKEDAIVMAELVRLGMGRTKDSEAELAAAQPLSEVTDVDEAEADIPIKREFDDLDRDDAEFGEALSVVTRGTRALARDAAFRAGRGPSIRLNNSRRGLIRTRTRALARRLLASKELAEMPAAEQSRVTRLLNAADNQRNLEDLTDRDVQPRSSQRSGEEEYVEKANLMKSRVKRMLADSGRAGCQEYRAVSELKFAALDRNAASEVQVLGRTFVSAVVRCVCDAANPRCPSCTDAQIPLARLQVDGCDVISVCALERRWVNSPRALAYWFPVVEALRQVLEKRCCPDECDESHHDIRDSATRRQRVREREVDVLRKQVVETLRLVRPPEDVPELREVLMALGDEFLERRPPSRSGADEDSRVAALERQVAELSNRLEELTRKRS